MVKTVNKRRMYKKIYKQTDSSMGDLLYIKAIVSGLYEYFDVEYPSNYMLLIACEHIKTIGDDIYKSLDAIKKNQLTCSSKTVQ